MPALLSRQNARIAATGLAGVRAGIGIIAWAAPKFAAAPWVGSEAAGTTGGKVLARALGSRDLALGAGALLAMRHDAPVRGWIEAGLLADAGDTLTTALVFSKLPRLTRWGIAAMTLGAVVAGAVIAASVDQAPDQPEI